MNKKIKPGSEFEELISVIQKCVHDKAIIEKNVKIPDVDTGELRQIDISLRIKDGPTELFAIIEVRDRSRPIGVPYIEELANKRHSVKADAAFIVSKSGFTKTALIKAGIYGIRTLTYDEATQDDWSMWFQCKTLRIYSRRYNNSRLLFAEVGSDKVMAISQKIQNTIRQDNQAKVLKTEDGTPYMSFPLLADRIINATGGKLFEGIPNDGSHYHQSIIVGEGQLDIQLCVENSNDQLCKIGKIKLDFDIYMEEAQAPFKLMKYRRTGDKNSIAEIAEAETKIGENRYKFEFIVPGAGDFIPAGTTVSLKATKLD